MLTASSNDPKRAESLLDREKNPSRWGTPYKTIVKTVIEKSVPSGNASLKAEMELKDKEIASLQSELDAERNIALLAEEKIKDAESRAEIFETEISEEILLNWSKKRLVALAILRFGEEIKDSLTIKDMVEQILSFNENEAA